MTLFSVWRKSVCTTYDRDFLLPDHMKSQGKRLEIGNDSLKPCCFYHSLPEWRLDMEKRGIAAPLSRNPY